MGLDLSNGFKRTLANRANDSSKARVSCNARLLYLLLMFCAFKKIFLSHQIFFIIFTCSHLIISYVYYCCDSFIIFLDTSTQNLKFQVISCFMFFLFLLRQPGLDLTSLSLLATALILEKEANPRPRPLQQKFFLPLSFI